MCELACTLVNRPVRPLCSHTPALAANVIKHYTTRSHSSDKTYYFRESSLTFRLNFLKERGRKDEPRTALSNPTCGVGYGRFRPDTIRL